MSLLMDALRKAEEAKKRAEQEKGTGENSPELTASVIAPAVDEANGPLEFEPTLSSSPDLSINVEFEEDASSILEPVAPVLNKSTLSEDLDKMIETVSLSLDSKAPHAGAAKPLAESISDSSAAQDSAGNNDFEAFLADAETVGEASPIEKSAEIELLLEAEPHADKVTPADSPTNDSVESIEFSSPSRQTDPQTAASPVTNYAQRAAEEYKAEQGSRSISERTAQGRKSAKSIFAAKRISGKNRQVFIYGGAGIAAVLVITVGYFALSSGPASNSFFIPEGGFVASSDADYGNENNGNIERFESDTVPQEDAFSANVDGTVDLSTQNSSNIAGVGQLQNPSLTDLQSAQSTQTLPAGLSITSTLALTPASAPIGVESAVSGSVEVVGGNQEPVAATAVTETATASSSRASQAIEPTLVPLEDGFNLSESLNESASEVSTDLITFRKKESRPTVSPQLSSAFAAYQAGDLGSALTLYDEVLLGDPRNIDALLGKAAISSVQGEIAQAMSLYSNVLTLNPSQAIARSGLLNLVPSVNPSDQERQLRRLIRDYPNVAPLAFALGNFYATQSRWIDAQKNYFNALSLAKEDSASNAQVSPDYAFNLAVSLDRLNQPGPAKNYYQEALALAAQFPANFNLETARRRIAKLTESGTP